MTSSIIITVESGVALVTLNEPDSRNALSVNMRAELEMQIPLLLGKSEVKAVVFIGEGEAFCGGGDLRTFICPQSPSATRARISRSHGWIRPLLTTEKPVITVVNGAAIGAGFGLAMLGDLIFTCSEAYFLPGFSLVGVAADYGLGLTLPRAVGEPMAKDILLTNRRITGEEAGLIRMVSRVMPREKLLMEALSTAERMVQGPTISLGLTKTLIARGRECSLDTYLDIEASAQGIAFNTEDFREGVSAFLEKRKAIFKGR